MLHATVPGGVADDFNNIITAISRYTNLILSQVDEDHPITLGGPIRRVARSGAVGTRRRPGSDGAHHNRLTGLLANDLLREQRTICLHAAGSGHDVTYP